MQILRVIVVMLMAVVLLMGCSDKQKDAAQLEQEMEERDSDTGIASDQIAEVDTAAEPVPDVSAVPEEETPGSNLVLSTGDGEGYSVQVASCESSQYAEHLVNLYTERGYEVSVSTFPFGGVTYYRVRIGDYATLGEATGMKAELADKYSLDTWIAPPGE